MLVVVFGREDRISPRRSSRVYNKALDPLEVSGFGYAESRKLGCNSGKARISGPIDSISQMTVSVTTMADNEKSRNLRVV